MGSIEADFMTKHNEFLNIQHFIKHIEFVGPN